jgi:hypothetical protein
VSCRTQAGLLDMNAHAKYPLGATVNKHPPVHHPLDARYYSVVDEPQLS